jgi:prephenate dehydratase
MASTIRKVDYFAMTVPDKPGEGHRVLAALAREGVNLLAMCGFPLGEGKAQIDVVPERPGDFSTAAERLKLRPRKPKKAFLIQGDDDRAGSVANVLGKLAAQKIPIIAAQALSAGSGRWAMILWVSPARVEKAAQALGA